MLDRPRAWSAVLATLAAAACGGGKRPAPPAPPAGPGRWHALRCNALANGMLEAAQLVRFELSRPEAFRYTKWSDAQMGKLTRGFAFLEANLPAEADMGAVAVACAIGWLDFRFPDLKWRDNAPELSAWFDRFSVRPSFSSTRHPGQ